MSVEPTNGVSAAMVDTLVLTYNRATDRLEIGGQCNSLELMLDVLSRATRVIEHKWRAERLKELRQQFADEARTQAILDSIKDRG